MTDSKLLYTFKQDSKRFLNELSDLLTKLEKDGGSNETVNSIFRCVHSIKSEADYIGLGEIADEAHGMETMIEPLRGRDLSTGIDRGLIEDCFYSIDRISSLLADRGSDTETADVSVRNADPVPSVYDDFELMLLREAEIRGETLYRLSFRISDEESMKYPRVYLVISNLEMNHNVIRVMPGIDGANIDEITVILSSLAGRRELSEEIDVDQIAEVIIEELSYSDEFENRSFDEDISEPEEADGLVPVYASDIQSHETEAERIISVEASEIDAISDSFREIKQRIADISSSINDEDAMSKLEHDLAGLESVSSGIEKMMADLRTVDFSSHFNGYIKSASALAERLGKKVELILPADVRVNRELADFMAEPLLQLVRNAVVHGIELPDVRAAAGKPETGKITLSAVDDDEKTIISVSDDGAGVDPDAEKNTSSDAELLEMLILPGFTTHGDSESYAGRGVGLDLVNSRVKRRGGKLELVNNPGAGCTFSMIFPK